MMIQDQTNITHMLQDMSSAAKRHLEARNITDYCMIGIQTGGVWIAEKLHALLDCPVPLGTLDISFYRDDFSRKGLNPTVKPSELPFDIENQHILLVDDVLMSGRTIRAAMNELFDYGRPHSVTLVTLVDLNARELPIQADIIGMKYTLPPNQRIKLRGPSPLHIELKEL